MSPAPHRILPVLLLLLLAAGAGAAERKPPPFRVVVSADSPLERVDRADLRQLLLGTRTRVGERQLVPVLLDGGEAHAALTRRVVGKSPRAFSAHWKRRVFSGRGAEPTTVPSSRAMAAHLRQHPRAIGYVDREQPLVGLKEIEVVD